MMYKYILKRILIFFPTLIIITLIGFIISVNAPGDPVERFVTASGNSGEIGSQAKGLAEQKLYWKKKLGLDLPVFYFSLSKYSYPDTLYKIYDKSEKEALGKLTDLYGDWEDISLFYKRANYLYNELSNFRPEVFNLPQYDKNVVSDNINTVKFEALSLKYSWRDEDITRKIIAIRNLMGRYAFMKNFQDDLDSLSLAYKSVRENKTSWKNYVPVIHFYPMNQYHRWLFGDKGVYSEGILRGDFGTSFQTKDAVSKTIFDRIGWSLFFSLCSVFLAYLVSIPIGVRAGGIRGGKFDRVTTITLFLLYSLPNFFVAIVLLMLFANPDMLDIFPASGVKPGEGYPENSSLIEKILLTLPHLIIPLICYTYSSLAFISRIVRGAMIENMGLDYIRTARAKGLSETTISWKHAFRNSLLPVITLFANVFPASVGGSVILESIFTIPGMGLEAYHAITTQNYPMIIAVLTLTSVLTLIGYLVSDVLYAIADPRITYKG